MAESTDRILIADSGSTKCDWLLLDANGGQRTLFSTMGFNPYFHTTSFVVQQLKEHEGLAAIASSVKHVFFYGAGSSSPELCTRIKEALSQFFTASTIAVDHDLVGAAYAVYDGEPCIAGILGTGSNSCLFDGKTVIEEVPALAYILGDEGSGSWFGKDLLRAYFYKQLPANLAKAFEAEYPLTKDELVQCVYANPHANVWLAGFMPFIGQHRQHEPIKSWIVKGLDAFVATHVCCYPNYQQLPVHFVGSIAWHFSDELRAVCKQHQVNCGKIIRKPIDALADYHLTYLIPQLLGQ
jgi:N-acetylglucosamine kinase-like BadF-type ATPase